MRQKLKPHFFSCLLIIFLSSFSAPASLSGSHSSPQSNNEALFKVYRILYQSPAWYVDNCMFWYEATVIVDFNDLTGEVNDIKVENETIMMRCKPPIYFTSTLSIAKTGYIESISFPETGDRHVDEHLSTEEFQTETVNGMNAEIDRAIREGGE
jgi:hypothetical protein